MKQFAALDLGSNSFHLLHAKLGSAPSSQIQFEYGNRLREKVQLGAGLDADQNLSQVAINRGLSSIKKFQAYIEEEQIEQVIACATNTLRIANNSNEFIKAAESILGISINVITGQEEAQLIFNAVFDELSEDQHKHQTGLVIDIGGGSTEFALGSSSGLQMAESLAMGCVSYNQRFFADGKIYHENIVAAEKAARLEIEPKINILNSTEKLWIAGTSGTLQSIAMLAEQFCDDRPDSLSRKSLSRLKQIIIEASHVKKLNFESLDSNRRAILPAGLAIVSAIFESLDIDTIEICQTSLCEGMLLELSGNETD